MRRAAGERLGIYGQRGFWLRCFLGKTIWVCLGVCFFIGETQAQIEVSTLHISRVHGQVTDKVGRPVASAGVSLVSVTDGEIVRKIETDRSGAFEIRCEHGNYWLRVEASGFSMAAQHVIVASSLRTALGPHRLYIMLGPKACEDACSPVYTSRKRFDHAVRLNAGQYE